MKPRPLIAGNWKMNGLTGQLAEARLIAEDLADRPAGAEVALCPSATLIVGMAQAMAAMTLMA